MPQLYQLRCECGHIHPVSAAQAGRVLECTCGRELRVPTLAGLRQLEPVEETTSRAPAATWNPLQGGLFVVGILLALIGLAVGGYYSYMLRQIDVAAIGKEVEAYEADVLKGIDTASPVEMYETWKVISKQGPGNAGSAVTLQAQQVFDQVQTIAIVGFVVAAVGIGAAALSLFLPGGKSR